MSCCVDGCDSTDLSKSQAKKPAAVRRCKVHVADNIAPPEPPGSVQRGTGNKRFKREDNAELLSAFARRESSGIDTSRRYKVRGVKEPRRSPWGLATKEEQKVGIALKADFEDWCGLHQSHAAFQRKLHAELRAEVDAPWPPNTEPAARQRHSRPRLTVEQQRRPKHRTRGKPQCKEGEVGTRTVTRAAAATAKKKTQNEE